MVGNDVPELGKPELRDRRQDFAFAFNWRRQNTTESGDSIRGRDQQTFFVDRINVAYFAATNQAQFGYRSFDYRCDRGHCHVSQNLNLIEAPSCLFTLALSRK